MPGNTEEREKCMDKLKQMQKFLPFLDFMIDKIKKKNNEVLLECQLSKLKVLRAMIAEKSGRYSWDVLIKVEDVIERLISKLDFKDQCEKSKENLANTDNCKTAVASTLSRVSSSTSLSTSQKVAGSEAREFSPGPDNISMKALKLSVGSSLEKSTDGVEELFPNSNQPADASEKFIGTTLDKDLDGFDLTDCPSVSESGSCNNIAAPDDLLSSSREKLLKSLQNKLLPCRPDHASQKSFPVCKNDKTSESLTSDSAFIRTQTDLGDFETRSEVTDSNEYDSRKTGESSAKALSLKLEKNRSHLGSNDANLKQRLKEKFSSDICEVYRVPGKSVGGSLRSLKEPKDQRKIFTVEEVELLKPDKITDKPASKTIISSSSSSVHTSQYSCEKKYRSGKPRHSSSASGTDKKNNKTDKKSSQKSGPEQDDNKSDEKQTTNSYNSESKSERESTNSKEIKKPVSKEESEDRTLELDKLNDEELLEFVKENMQYLPHLAKLNPSELRKAVKSSALNNFAAREADSVSEISDDSFQDLDEFVTVERKTSRSRKSDTSRKVKQLSRPLTSVNITQVGSDGVAKNVKPIVEPSKDLEEKFLEEVGDKTHDMDNIPEEDSLEEEDYAQKLIEETTPVAVPVKKKGLLELPMPIMDELFDDISSIESFETFSSPNETADQRRALPTSSERKSRSKSEESADSEKTGRSVSSGRFTLSLRNPISKNFFNSSSAAPADPRCNQIRSESWPGKGADESNNRRSNELSDSVLRTTEVCPKTNPSLNKVSRRCLHNAGEPKSYAEYKRTKLKEREKLHLLETAPKESPPSSLPDNAVISPAERGYTPKKCADPRLSRSRDAVHKQLNPKSHHSISTYGDRKKPLLSGARRHSDHVDCSLREDRKSDDVAGKVCEKKRYSIDSEELVSPLEELYRNESKPKTGRGYGLQNFKIPKIMREFPIPLKSSENQAAFILPTKEVKNRLSVDQSQSDSAREAREPVNTLETDLENQKVTSGTAKVLTGINVEKFRASDDKSEQNLNSANAEDVSKKIVKVYSNKTLTKTLSSTPDDRSKSSDVVNSDEIQTKIESSEIREKSPKPAPESVSHESENLAGFKFLKSETIQPLTDGDKDQFTKSEPKVMTEAVRKCEAQIVECDSSMEYSGVNKQNAANELATSTEKSSVVPKEEITREFVEALIRKSFQSGEGKLLLAHAKLFEEFARKLNSKKLKTIQKIINSETETSSSTEIYSEEERKKKKNKKSEEKSQKTKKLRKKGRKSRRQISSSASSSSSEIEETSGEECDKRESPSVGSECRSREQSEEISSLTSGKKIKKRRRCMEFGKDFSGGRAKRKQRQKKMLEKILNESPQAEASPEVNPSNSCEATSKESEPKAKKAKGKPKTELDRLHDDIRNMFLNAGAVTPTGQRMCRILRQSGGNLNKMDIVKESAKMVEEEKLKKVTRSCARNSQVASRSLSVDKAEKNAQLEQESEKDPKLKCELRVALQRVDLDRFGYAVKISNDCISFKRMQGRNTAIRSTGSPRTSDEIPPDHGLMRNVFLPRNIRKVEKMKMNKCKKSYIRKRLADVVQNLPLKMAKMKHLQICEKSDDELNKSKRLSGKSPKKSSFRKSKSDVEFSNTELLNYAFERIRVMYSCKLCSQVTRYITGHYKVVHPEHEVLISRLCQGEARRAKLDAKRNRYDNPREENPLAKSMKRRMKMLLNTPNSYNCRMCSTVKTQDLELFRAHVSSHTGEFRFQCPADGCRTRTYSRQDIKIHILTKHSKNRAEYSKVAELYTIVVEGNKMFGFLCSLCNFVQLNRSNVVEHMSRQHPSLENAKIIKINMSAYVPKAARKKLKNIQNEEKNDSVLEKETNDFVESEDAAEILSKESGRFDTKLKNGGNEGCIINQSSEEELFENKLEKNEDDFITVSAAKKVLPVEDPNDEDKVLKKSDDASLDEFSVNPSQEHEMEVDSTDIRGSEEDRLHNAIEVEDCVDLKNITAVKGNESTSTAEGQEEKNISGKIGGETPGTCQRIKVGPLEAQLSENSTVLYECCVKGCLFFTKGFDLFEKHIKISHGETKWTGNCEICAGMKVIQPFRENSYELLTALRHLKLHEREKVSGGKISKEDLIMELNLLNSSVEGTIGGEEIDERDVKSSDETKESDDDENAKKTENAEAPYPPKPLLRVRNLLGDRLSTPKECPDVNEVVAVNEEPETVTEEESSNSMFTIENVRTLNDAPPEDSEIQIQHVCSLKDSSQTLPQLAPGKTILVRSCPSRKIAIRPEPSSLSIDVGQVNVVQAPVATHPVVLGPLTSASPIRIISSSVSPKPAFTVQPVLVSADPVRMNVPNVLSIINPTLSSVASAAPSSETGDSPPPALSEGAPATAVAPKPALDITVIPTPVKATSSVSTSTSLVDVESGDERDSVTLQRIHSNPNAGNKRVKDAKIYEQMLTKSKLCHLFKCMGIECSFTCNDELVFRQHIGLHEAQRRLKKNEGMRTIILRLANRTTRAFYWQQCSYCCELLTNTTSALSQHILEDHGHCMYQCAFCFYRAVSQSYVEIHQNLAHIQILKTAPRVIYKCKPLRTPPSQAAALEKHRRRQSVRPYHCDQCGRKFFITQDFINHLTTQHQSVTAYTCHICKNLCFKADRLVVHYKLHSYCTYQCAYCLHGTETEKEMVFHLCNFHFSQPPVMYVRAIAEGRSHDVKEKQMKSKKHLSNQLDSLKVVVYESDTLNADCIVEVDPDEETPESGAEASQDLSAIANELGINADAQSPPSVTPLMKELASIGDKNANNLAVKTLLPNAQFSTENENKAENCSVLISSGLSAPSDDSNERAMNIPLGQLPLEVVSVQHNESAPQKNIAPPDKNLKLNEIIVNLQNKDKAAGALGGVEDESKPSAVHKLPPVVLSRSSALKNVYSSRSAIAKKNSGEPEKIEENPEGNEGLKSKGKSKEGTSVEENAKSTTRSEATVETEKKSSTGSDKTSAEEPLLITSVVSLSDTDFVTEEVEKAENGIVISKVCSLSDQMDSGPSEILINIQSQVNSPTALKPPIIRVEDFPVGKKNKESLAENSSNADPEKKDNEKEGERSDVERSSSPDVIILDVEKSKSIITVTLDSDDEIEISKQKPDPKDLEDVFGPSEDDTIRKEMEVLRNQIASETDSLLFDESEGQRVKSDLLLNIESNSEETAPKSLLSPIEEAICSLNKKLQSETEQAQKKEGRGEVRTDCETEKTRDTAEEERSELCTREVPERRRTRFASRCRKQEKEKNSERKDGDESRKREPGKWRKVKEGLVGKDLYACGNESCDFAADDESALKDHLYVCDFSRETSGMTCPHCRRQTKHSSPASYLDHLKCHGEKKHHCGLCEYSAVDASVTRHVKLKHKCSALKILPKDSQPGHLWYYPKNYKVDKVDFEVNGYSPGDEDKLPLQSVYQVNVKCAKCPYFTKVRSNMVRHLKIHVKSVETEGVVVVPSTAPTNPVPCLETKERMFDKMTNLAASSQLAQAKEKTAVESLTPEEEAKLPQFVAEQLRYKCCLPDCNYITVDEGMLKHHIKALHDEINYYSCPHCRDTVHVDVRHVTLDKIGHHLKHHDVKLYKCAHCIYFHYQKNIVEKHTVEKHPDRRYFVHTVREPKPEVSADDDNSSNEGSGGPRVWKCALCDNFRSPSKATVKDHLLKSHNIKSKYRCKLCPMKGNNYNAFCGHFASKHPGEKVSYMKVCLSEKAGGGSLESGNSSGADSSSEHFDTTPLWQRGTPRIRHIRGILIEEEEIKTKKSKKGNAEESEADAPECVTAKDKSLFYCPLCTNKKKPFFTRSEEFFRTHLYQELNYQQFACILCGKMFVDKKDFYRHHARVHRDKAPALKRTKEDHEIKFWVDKVIARRVQQLEERKRKLSSDGETSGIQRPPKKKKEV